MSYSQTAQEVIDHFILSIRKEPHLEGPLNTVLEDLVKATNADRGLIFLIAPPKMKITHEYTEKSTSNALGYVLNPVESTPLVLNLLGQAVNGSHVKFNRTDETIAAWSAYFKISESYMSHLLLPFSSCGTFMGFLALQNQESREWKDEEVLSSVKVAEFLSIPLWYEFQHWRETGQAPTIAQLK